jgi:hypothetical protein
MPNERLKPLIDQTGVADRCTHSECPMNVPLQDIHVQFQRQSLRSAESDGASVITMANVTPPVNPQPASEGANGVMDSAAGELDFW